MEIVGFEILTRGKRVSKLLDIKTSSCPWRLLAISYCVLGIATKVVFDILNKDSTNIGKF
jgi:hypothetical protein